MITHIVFFKLLDQSPSNIEKARDVFMGMKGKIPQLRHLEVGIDILRTQRSYDLALVTKFDSLEDLQAYQSNPIHVEVTNYIASVRESAVAVDYESL